jgi:hypothetical protein
MAGLSGLKRAARRAKKRAQDYLRPVITFQVQVTEHCNLDCIGCNVFSPIADRSFLDLPSYERDIKRIHKLFGDRCEIILLGGEPLLHKDLAQFFEVTRRLMRRSRISILTNGVLMLRQPEAFWQSLKDNAIVVLMTKYPVKVDYEGIIERCRSYGIECGYHDGEEPKDTLIMQAINVHGTGDAARNYSRCSVRSCTSLGDGKLFPCMIARSIGHFNKYFGYDIPVSADDYVDIHRETSPRSVRRKLYNRKQPIPMCKYCDIDTKLVSCVDYTRSRKELSEWVNLEKTGA